MATTLWLPLLLCFVGTHCTTWTTQSPTIPDFEWVVIDHGNGNSFAFPHAIADDGLFVAGVMSNVLTLTNAETGEAVESTDQGSDPLVYIAKVSFDGSPLSVWTYPSTLSEFPMDMAFSNGNLCLAGLFSGNITFGDITLTTSPDQSHAFIVMLSADDGAVQWARKLATNGTSSTVYRPTFVNDGRVAIGGIQCGTPSSEGACSAVFFVLNGADGSIIWQRDFGPQFTRVAGTAFYDNKYYLTGGLLGAITVDDLDLAPAANKDALLLVLDVDGTANWAAMIDGEDTENSRESIEVQVADNAVYMMCYNGCRQVRSTRSNDTAVFGGSFSGGVAKISTDGVPMWAANLPTGWGMAATKDAVYMNFPDNTSPTFGDTKFTDWGGGDVYIAKIDAATGAGAWVLQTGGQGSEAFVCSLIVDDRSGDIYSVGMTSSVPSYFDPLIVDTHNTDDGFDLFIAKLKTSAEKLPSCKTDETTIVEGFCFVNNVCYQDGTPSRAMTTEACMKCSAGESQTEFTMSTGYCFIDGVCYPDGAAGSTCQYCDVTKSTISWSVQDGFYLAQDQCQNSTWTTQSPMIPEFEWVVIDHSAGNDLAFAADVSSDAIYVSGATTQTLRVQNAQTGEAIEGTDAGNDDDIYIAKISFDGSPLSVWMYAGSEYELTAQVAVSHDDTFVTMAGMFTGNITLGDETFTKDGTGLRDGFVAKLLASNGEIVWATHLPGSGDTSAWAVEFDSNGNVAVTGRRCDVPSGASTEVCGGFAMLLAADDGATIWERDFGPSFDLIWDIEVDHDVNGDNFYYLAGQFIGTLEVDEISVASHSPELTDALLLVLDKDGIASWAATMSAIGDEGGRLGGTGARLYLVKVLEDSVYVQCSGASCLETKTTASDITVRMEGVYNAGIIKMSTAGVPIWAADVPNAYAGPDGMAVASDAAYVSFNNVPDEPQTFGDTTFTDWGAGDVFLVKLDAKTGAGQWVLQAGGPITDFGSNVIIDRFGDVYLTGLTFSVPLYFDPLVVDTHSNLDGTDFFVAKLKTSDEKLPSCKTDETTIVEGFCFVNNVCYQDGTPSRVSTAGACMKCSAGESQTEFTMSDGYCFIDGVCYPDGAAGSTCQYCDVTKSTDSWSVQDGFYLAQNQCQRLSTWTTQSPMIPEFEWVVIDHGSGDSFAFPHAVADDGLFVAGVMSNVLTLTNAETGDTVESTDQGSDPVVYIAKVSLDGSPLSVWTYPSTLSEFPMDMAFSNGNLCLAGLFSGNITFGEITLTTSPDQSHAFIVMLSADDGAVQWARKLAADGVSSTVYRPTFANDGRVAIGGVQCGTPPSNGCSAVFFVLNGTDGSIIWERDFGPQFTRVAGTAFYDNKYYLTGGLLGAMTVDDLDLAPAANKDALLLVLDVDGIADWAAMIDGEDTENSRESIEVQVADNVVYMMCYNGCRQVRSTKSDEKAFFGGSFSGGVAKISTAGVPMWAANLPTGWGMAATKDAVYMNFPDNTSPTFGDTNFTDWGGGDVYIAKIDAATGAGAWVLQTGGQGSEAFVCSLIVDDRSGDIYSVGMTSSVPSYFDPLVVDTHNTDDGFDLFIAKLKTSDEKLPSCKTDETTIVDGFCFVNNVCYQDGTPSRAVTTEACMKCSAGDSQSEFTMSGGYCFIDGVCYPDGATHSVGDGVDATCFVCDISVSTHTWTSRSGSLSEDGRTCEEEVEVPHEDEDVPASKVIAGYVPATNVSSHAKMDLDAQEMRELSDRADFDSALFVYENGGNGLCSEEDIRTADVADSCYGKTVSDAKGNSVYSSGGIRTIYSFATAGPLKMVDHKWYPIYRDYWGDDIYADTFVRKALSASTELSSRSDAMRAALSTKGAVYQAVWMYMLHETEEAIVQCKAGNTFVSDTSTSAPHRWDEFWAFYAGSLEGVDGTGQGEFMWALAERRCPQFATCDPRGRTALANERALELAYTGLDMILVADCTGLEETFNAIVDITMIPLIQSLLKYVYDVDPAVNGGSCTGGACSYDEAWAKGWAFAAAVLPRIHECNPVVAQLVRDNLDVDTVAGKPMKDGFRAVKVQIEETYSCLGITCADVGAYQTEAGVHDGMEACMDNNPNSGGSKKNTKTNHTPVIALAVVLAVIFIVVLALVVQVCVKRKRSSDGNYRSNKTKNTLVSDIKDNASETTASDVTHLEIEDINTE